MVRDLARGLALTSIICILLASSGAIALAKEVVVREGESLSMIAQRELGSMSRWEEIARANNISDPRKVKAGMRLMIPGAGAPGPGVGAMTTDPTTVTLSQLLGDMKIAPPVSPEPDMKGAHVRPRAGAARVRPQTGAEWQNLVKPVGVVAGTQVMTAVNGWADMRSGDAFLEIGPYTVLRVDDLMPQGGAMLRLQVGSVIAHSQGSPILVEAEAGKVNVMSAEAKIMVDTAGNLKVSPISGAVKIVTSDGKTTMLEPGKWAWVKPGSQVVVKEQVSAVMLVSPVGNKVVADKDVLFEWTPMPGARGYKFAITADAPSQLKLEEQTMNPKIVLTMPPEGGYSWRVTPLGMAEATPSIPGRFMVARNAPGLELMPPVWGDGAWWLKGKTSPGAWVTVGSETIRADDRGEFTSSLGVVDGILMLGVEARLVQGGAVTRKAMTVAGRPSRSTIPVWVKIPSGSMMLNDEPAPQQIMLTEGRNAFFWQWVISEMTAPSAPMMMMPDAMKNEAARGRFELMVDMTPPMITSVKSSMPKVKTGEEVTIMIGAEDKGSGIAEVSAARITVKGPNGWAQDIRASSMNASGEYIFKFRTPSNLRSGVLRITAIEISDNDGNVIMLDGEGMTTDIEDPNWRLREFFHNILLIGAGVALGAAL